MEEIKKPDAVQIIQDDVVERLSIAFAQRGKPLTIDASIPIATKLTMDCRVRNFDTELEMCEDYYRGYFNVMIDLLTEGIMLERFEQFQYGRN